MELPTGVRQLFRAAPGSILTTRDLRRRGYHRLEVAAWAANGLTERLLHGVYREANAGVPDNQCLHLPLRYLNQRLRPGCPRPLISGLAGVAARDAGQTTLPIKPLVLVDRSCTPRGTHYPFTTCRAAVGTLGRVAVEGVESATSARCLADAVAVEGAEPKELLPVIDDLRSRGHCTSVELSSAWLAANHDGARSLRGLVRDGHLEQESEGERRAFAALFGGGLPPAPDCQVVVLGRFRVDFVFLSAGLIIEYYGRDSHEGRLEADNTRVHALERVGFRVIIITASMLWDAPALAAWIQAVRREREQMVATGVLRLPPLPPQPPRLSPLRTLHPFG